jgi:hypothetical protein
MFSIYPILPAALGPGVHSASNKNEYWGVKRGRCVWLTTLPPSVSRLSRQCGILNMSHPYEPPRPVIRTDILLGHGVISLYTVSMTPCTGDQPVARPLPTHWTPQTEYTHTYIHASIRIRTQYPIHRLVFLYRDNIKTFLRSWSRWK